MLNALSAPWRAVARLLDDAAGERRAGGAVIENVQCLRALAAALVVFVHLEVFLRALGLQPFGYGGVDLFFVISGFIMVHTTRRKPVGPAAFLANRLLRIAPLYWLLTCAVYGVALVAPSLLGATSTDATQLVESVAFVPFRKASGAIYPVLFVGWTLNYEMFFYVLFAVGLLAPRREHGVLGVMAALVALVVLGRVLPSDAAAYTFYTDPIVLEFGFGMALALYGDRLGVSSKSAQRGLFAAGVLGLLATATLAFVLPDANRVLTYGVPAALVVTAAVVLHQSGVSFSSRTLLALGNASFALYLTHPFVTQAATKVGAKLGLSPLVAAGGAALTFVAVCGVGLATHLALERPLTRACRRFVTGRARVPAAVAGAPGEL